MPYDKLKSTFSGVDYLDIIKNKRTILTLKSHEINNKPRREIEEKIGNEFGEGVYNYRVKFFDNEVPAIGRIRAVRTKPENKQEAAIEKKINAIENKLASLSQSGGVDFNMVMELIKSTYTMQIEFLKSRIAGLEADNARLNKELKETSAQGGGVLDQLAPLIIAKFLGGDAAAIKSLAEHG